MRADAATVVDIALLYGVTPARIRQIAILYGIEPTGMRWKAKLYDPKAFRDIRMGHHRPKTPRSAPSAKRQE